MNPKAQLYTSVKAALLAKSEIKHVALYNSQFDNLDEEPTFPLPCVLFEYTDITWTSETEGIRKGETIARLHIAFQSLKTEDLDLFNIVEIVDTTLEGFELQDVFSPLRRSFEEQDTDHDQVTIWISDYTTILTDTTAARRNKLVEVQLNEIEIENNSSQPFLRRK